MSQRRRFSLVKASNVEGNVWTPRAGLICNSYKISAGSLARGLLKVGMGGGVGLTACEVDQVGGANLPLDRYLVQNLTNGNHLLVFGPRGALVGQDDGAIAAATGEAVVKGEADSLGGKVCATALLVDEPVLELFADSVPLLRAARVA